MAAPSALYATTVLLKEYHHDRFSSPLSEFLFDRLFAAKLCLERSLYDQIEN